VTRIERHDLIESHRGRRQVEHRTRLAGTATVGIVDDADPWSVGIDEHQEGGRSAIAAIGAGAHHGLHHQQPGVRDLDPVEP
jgi:hypothetical protein